MKRWLPLPLLFCLALATQPLVAGVAEDCVADLNYLPLFLLKNDAGARDALARSGGGELSHAFARAKARASKASTETACRVAIGSYLEAWRNGHLTVQSIDEETQDRSIAVGNSEQDYEPMIRLLSGDTVLLEINSFHPSACRR